MQGKLTVATALSLLGDTTIIMHPMTKAKDTIGVYLGLDRRLLIISPDHLAITLLWKTLDLDGLTLAEDSLRLGDLSQEKDSLLPVQPETVMPRESVESLHFIEEVISNKKQMLPSTRRSLSPNLDKRTDLDKVTCEAREELQEYMHQYASCADPSESAARKERMRLAKEKGETEEVVRNMVAASIALNASPLISEELNATGTTPLGRSNDFADNSPGRIPALNRLGSPTDSIVLPSDPVEGRIPAKKRLGRPPLAKKQSKPLGVNASSSVKKRRVAQVRISPKRCTAPSSSTRGAGARRAATANQDAQAQTGTRSMDSQPRTRIIPGVVKRKVDFHNPPAPVH